MTTPAHDAPNYTPAPEYSAPTDAAAVPPLWAPYYGAPLSAAWSRFWAKYATLAGRASRSEYWKWVLINTLALLVLGGLTGVLATVGAQTTPEGSQPGPLFGVGIALVVAWYLATLVPNIALTVRRLHDANLSGWLYLLILVPSLGSLLILVFTVLPSQPDGARFDQAN